MEDNTQNNIICETLPVGSIHNAYISHIEDGPYSFSIQLQVSTEEEIPNLNSQLKQEKLVLSRKHLLPGTKVMTETSSDFRRSMVVSVKHNYCQVYHLDYGSTEEIPFCHIYTLPSWAYHLPAKALCFCLSDVKSLEITDKGRTRFHSLLGEKVIIRVTEQESDGPSMQYCEVFYKSMNAKDIILESYSILKYERQTHPWGKNVGIVVSHVISPSLFFVQYRNKLELLKDISNAVTSYSLSQPHFKDSRDLEVGTPVAALFEDSAWCRGMVVDFENDWAEILYVDYGYRKRLALNHICKISRDLISTWRVQAVECCLQGFQDFEETDANEQLISAMEQTYLQNMFMTPLYIMSGQRLIVELVDEIGGKLSEKLKLLKLHSTQIQNSLPAAESQNFELSHQNSEDFSLDCLQSNDQLKWSNNAYIRPSVRPFIQKYKVFNNDKAVESSIQKKYDDNKDEFMDFKNSNFFEMYPRFNRNNKKDIPFFDWNLSENDEKIDEDALSEVSSYENFRRSSSSVSSSILDKPNEFVSNRIERLGNLEQENRGSISSKNKLGIEVKNISLKEDGTHLLSWKTFCSYTRNGGQLPKFEYYNANNNNEYKKSLTDNNYIKSTLQNSKNESYIKLNNNHNFNSDSTYTSQKRTNFQNNEAPSEVDRLDSSILSPSSKLSKKGADKKPKIKEKKNHYTLNYPLTTIAVNDQLQVFVSSMSNPHYFFVQKSGSESELDNLKCVIRSYEKGLKPVKEELLTPGLPVIAKFSEDQTLYRGTVKKIISKKEVEVLFVDYGNSETVPMCDLFSVPQEILKKHLLALHCYMCNVKPTKGGWSKDSSVYDPLINGEDCFKMTVNAVKLIDDEIVVGVELTNPDGTSVSQSLVKSQLAALTGKMFSKGLRLRRSLRA